MTTHDFLADCRRRVANAVEAMSSPPTIDMLVALSLGLDRTLPLQLQQVILEHPDLFIRGAASAAADKQIEVGDRRFEVVVCDAMRQPRTLDAVFIERGYGVSRKRARLQHHKLENAGRYKRIRICLPPELALDTDFVLETSQTILGAGYALLKEKLYSAIVHEKVSIARELYEFLHICLPNEKLLSNLWLASMSNDKCFYLLEPKVAMSSLEIIGPVADDIGTNPINALAEFMTRLTDVELSHAKGIVNVGHCVDIDLQTSKYKKTAFLLAQAQMAIFESNWVSIFPISRLENTWLVAFFPAEHRPAIEPVLQAHKKELEDIFKKTHHRFAKITTLYQEVRRHFRTGGLGEFVGGVLKGWLG